VRSSFAINHTEELTGQVGKLLTRRWPTAFVHPLLEQTSLDERSVDRFRRYLCPAEIHGIVPWALHAPVGGKQGSLDGSNVGLGIIDGGSADVVELSYKLSSVAGDHLEQCSKYCCRCWNVS